LFIFDFVFTGIMDAIFDWIYAQVVGFFGNFFSQMGNMGADLFTLGPVQGIVLFFRYLGWSLYVVGLVVALFEFGIERQSGRGNVKDLAINAIKGFMAASLFTIVPVELYKLAVTLQGTLTSGLTGFGNIDGLATNVLDSITNFQIKFFSSYNNLTMLFVVILMGYAIIKVFFGNLKRGGILLVQIAVGSLYMFSVPRGYIDGFTQWMKQVIGLCLTAFLQSTILVVGLLVMRDHPLLGLGLMLSATEIPRVANQFGLDTGTRANIAGMIYTTQSVINLTKTVAAVVK
jgi:hypothetical protein